MLKKFVLGLEVHSFAAGFVFGICFTAAIFAALGFTVHGAAFLLAPESWVRPATDTERAGLVVFMLFALLVVGWFARKDRDSE